MAQISNAYSKALIELSIEEKKLDVYLEIISSLNVILLDSEIINFLDKISYPQVSREEKVKIMEEAFDKYLPKEIMRLFYVAIDRNELKDAIASLSEFEVLARRELGIKKGIVWSSLNLEDKQMERLEKAIMKKLNISKLILENKIDKKLIGGIRIDVEDNSLDLSVKGRLEKLAQTAKGVKLED